MSTQLRGLVAQFKITADWTAASTTEPHAKAAHA
jgi:hypothetical protein